MPNGEPKSVRVLNRYPADDHFVIETPAGKVTIKAIKFAGELRITQMKLPIVYTGEYRDANTVALIAQVMTYAPQSIMGNKFAVEFHKLTETGEAHVTLRRLPNDV